MGFFNFGQPAPVPTAESISRQRALANALMQQSMDASPVQHWTQGLARVLAGGLGGYRGSQADAAAAQMKQQEEAKAAAERAAAEKKAQAEAMMPDWKIIQGQGIYDMNPRRNPTPLMVSQFATKKDEMTAYQKAQMEERRKDREWRQRQQQAGKIPSAVQTKNLEAETAVANLTNELDNYDALVKQGGYARVGTERDAVNTARTNIQMQMKELYNLGVLNGPDLELMNKMLVDPTYSVGATFNPFSEERGVGGVIAGTVGDYLGQGTGIENRVSANVKQLKDQFQKMVKQRLKTTGAPAPMRADDSAPTLDGPALSDPLEIR